MHLLAITEANSVLDLVDDGFGGTTVDLMILLAAALVEDFLSSRLIRVGLSASGNAVSGVGDSLFCLVVG